MDEHQGGERAHPAQPKLMELTASSIGEAQPKTVEGGEGESLGPVRLRRPQRQQLAMVVQCPDDLIPPDHTVRTVAKVVERLDLAEFYEPIKAREGEVGRDATDPALLIGLWLYACIRGVGSARELARRCEESAPFQWLCGGVSVNHRMLSDFRTDRGKALDGLLTQVITALVAQGVVKVSRISQDGVRVRVGAGASSFRREERLGQLLKEVQQHVEELRRQIETPGAVAGEQAKKLKAQKRRAAEKQKRVEQALEQLAELKRRQEEAARKAGQGKRGQQIRDKELRASTTDPEARVMKMANGGFNPAVNIQMATDTESRAIVGVEVSNEGSDSAGLSEPMREQVGRRTGKKVKQQLLDGGYIRTQDIENAHTANVELFIPPRKAKSKKRQGRELEPEAGDSEAILEWKKRMSSEVGKEIYKQRGATSETVNADLRTYRGLSQILVRGLAKAQCVALWCALAYNLMHFSTALLG